jgi:ubiquinone/menaquinone biosynthesis C-methylase UbiE
MKTDIRSAVKEKYGQVAASALSTHDAGVRAVAEAFGYSANELDSIPAEANMGLSCGNPTAFASLKPGEVVIDLGSGGGLDVFLAAQKVGPTGKAIGIDMTPAMIERARKNVANGPGGQPIKNVEFHLAQIDELPLDSASADCVISNCVINLAPDKTRVFREMFRVLKPGGRVAISDIALKQPLPADLAQSMMAFVGCIAGAISIEEYRHGLLDAGFSHVVVQETGTDLNAYANVEQQAGCCSPPMESEPVSLGIRTRSFANTQQVLSRESSSVHEGLAALMSRYNVNEFAASVKVYAIKPSH